MIFVNEWAAYGVSVVEAASRVWVVWSRISSTREK